MRKVMLAVGLLLTVAVIAIPASAVATATSPGLWVVDDVTSQVYKIDVTGAVDPSVGFAVTGQYGISRANSDVAVDNTDGTLWLAAEKSPSIGAPGGVVNWGTVGAPLRGIPETTYLGDGTEGVAVDLWAGDGTLWVVDDPEPARDTAGNNLARLRHLDRSGAVLGSWPAWQNPFSTSAPSTQAIAVDPMDGTLWVTDNVANRILRFSRPAASDPALTEIVANRINPVAAGKFGVGTAGVDRLTDALQGVTVDPNDGTLWVTARQTTTFLRGKIFRITRTGELIASFFSSDVYGGDNPTGIAYACTSCRPDIGVSPAALDLGAVSSGGSVSAPVTIANTGTDTLTVTALGLTGSSDFTLAAGTPAPPISVPVGGSVQVSVTYTPTGGGTDTGALAIASNDPQEPTVNVSLSGSEKGPFADLPDWALFGLPGGKLKIDNADRLSGVVGRVGLGPGAEQDFREGLLTGTYVVDPAADNSHANEVVISDGTVRAALTADTSAVQQAAAAAAGLTPQQTYGDVKSTTTIVGVPGVNVVQVRKIELDGTTLTLGGTPTSTFVVNIGDRFKLRNGGSIAVTGGLRAENILFNIVGDGDSSIESGGFATGKFLAPRAKFTVKDSGSMLLGSLFGGKETNIIAGGRLRQLSESLPPGELGQAAGFAALGLPKAKVRLIDAASTVLGDVALGPLSEQGFDRGRIEGRLIVDPAARNANANAVVVTGGTVRQALSRAAADAIDASVLAARLTPDRTIVEIKSTTTITAGPALTVIAGKKVELDGNEVMRIVGGPQAVVVFNLEEKVLLKNRSSIVLSGGIPASHVIFNIRGDHDSSIESSSIGLGTILAPYGKVKVKDAGSVLQGAAISADEVVVEKGGRLVHAP